MDAPQPRTPPLIQRLFSLQGRTALITGAGGGIGAVLAVAFAQAGAAVGAHSRSENSVTAILSEIRDSGGSAVHLGGDISSVDDCRGLILQAREALGRIDILVNCAGINRRRPIADVTQDDFDAIVAANLRSAFFIAQAVHPIMREQGGGKIINIGSLTTHIALGGVSVYGMTKAGLGQLTKTMAVEWARDNIQANCLAPGFLDTPLTHDALWGDHRKREWILSRTPAHRAGTPDDVLGAALLLAAPASDFITGQIINVDGGFLAGGWWDA